jgi:high-affinity iron transporter
MTGGGRRGKKSSARRGKAAPAPLARERIDRRIRALRLIAAVFLLAVFQQGTSPVASGVGAVLGVVAALMIGWGIYRGGVRLDLQRFFKATGVVLVIVAAGLLASGVHSAQELGWIGGADDGFLNLAWLVHPGTWTASLMTGILGLREQMSSAMVIGWLLYAVPMTCFVLWPQGRRTRPAPATQQPTGAAQSVRSPA